MSYPQPPAPAAYPAGQPRLRGRTPLRLGIIFLVLGIAAAVVGGIIAVNGALKKVDSFQRISIPPAGHAVYKHVKFGTGGYVAYYEAKSASAQSIPEIPIKMQTPSGSIKTLDTPYGGTSGGSKVKSLTYNYNGHNGVALWQFTISQKGTYLVRVEGNTNAASDAKIAFGRSIGKSTAVGALLIVLGILLLIAGVILLIVGLVKRSRSKRERDAMLASGPYGGYGPPMGAPPPPVQPGYSPPSYGQPPAQPGYPPSPPPQQSQWPPSNES